ncbi:hypothetical protein BDW22DRAFT_1027955 [Trametopsis cervina]|nr:hypothetical protein BDW22DRAFT_1027955 [Trametopsis cervina]
MKLSTVALFSLSLAPVVLSLALTNPEARWSNAKRMANGLPPLAPRRLYNANVARQAVASPTSSSDTAASSSTAASTPPLPTAASVQAFVVNTVTGSSTVQPFRRRQTVGSSAGWLTQVAQLVPTNRNVRFSLTTDPEVAVGVYPTDYQQPSASQPISEFICLSNGHSIDQTRTQPITLSPSTGDYLYLADCGSDLDQPAGSPATHNPAAVEPEYYGETRVWQIDPTTGQVTFHYVNPDGSVAAGQIPVTFGCPDFGTPSSTAVFVTSNIQAFRDEFVQRLFPGSVADPDACFANEIALFYSTS